MIQIFSQFDLNTEPEKIWFTLIQTNYFEKLKIIPQTSQKDTQFFQKESFFHSMFYHLL